MGVEPTAARSARPATDFEDRGIHRDTTTPIGRLRIYQGFQSKQLRVPPYLCTYLALSLRQGKYLLDSLIVAQDSSLICPVTDAAD